MFVSPKHQGIPITAEVAVPAGGQGANTTEPSSTREASLSGIPNASPLNLFPQVYMLSWLFITIAYYCMYLTIEIQQGDANDGDGAGGGTLEFLRHNQQVVILSVLPYKIIFVFCSV